MKDVTTIFKKAMACEENWAISIFHEVLAELKQSGSIISYWDNK